MADARPIRHRLRLRLIDLAIEWPLQYAGESTLFDASAFPGARDRLEQVEGYLSTASAAITWIGATPGDDRDPWAQVGGLISRIEAEFPGRLLTGADDLDRWRSDPIDRPCWAVAAVRGCLDLARSPTEVDRLLALVDRGVRAFRLAGFVDRPGSIDGDDRGLGDLGRDCLDVLARSADEQGAGGLLIDLAGLGRRRLDESIGWFEARGGPGRLVPILTLATADHAAGSPADLDALRRLRSLGGLIGLCPGMPFHRDLDAFRRSIDAIAAIPFLGRVGIEGIAIGTGFLAVDANPEGLDSAGAILSWLSSNFEPEAAARLASGNAEAMLDRLGGADTPRSAD